MNSQERRTSGAYRRTKRLESLHAKPGKDRSESRKAPECDPDPEERKYLAVSIKHTEWRWKFGDPCVLWGRRTPPEGPRSFGGYTKYPRNAELYSLKDWARSWYAGSGVMKIDEPVHIGPNLCKKYRNFDTVLIAYDEYCGYCSAADLPTWDPERSLREVIL